MEEDLILGNEQDEPIMWEYIDYHAYINSGFNALCALEGLDIIDKKEKAKIEEAKRQAIFLIRRSIDELVKQFDEEHD